jgi:hypothetical protein
MQFGYHCEECEEAVWPATTRAELAWLKNRRHIVLEVQRHLGSGLDGWIDEGLAFLDRHDGHSVIVAERGGSTRV